VDCTVNLLAFSFLKTLKEEICLLGHAKLLVSLYRFKMLEGT
jgi:hypothetical protein